MDTHSENSYIDKIKHSLENLRCKESRWDNVYNFFLQNPAQNINIILKYLPQDLLNEIISNNIFDIMHKKDLLDDLIFNHMIFDKYGSPKLLNAAIDCGYELFRYYPHIDYLSYIEPHIYGAFIENKYFKFIWGYHFDVFNPIIKYASIEITKSWFKNRNKYINDITDILMQTTKNIFSTDITNIIFDYYCEMCCECLTMHTDKRSCIKNSYYDCKPYDW